ncbi:MAG: transporter, partial [Rhizobium sp.]|nr:transporter [Rhizobium sp.]
MLPLIKADPGLVRAKRINPDTGQAEPLPIDNAPAAQKDGPGFVWLHLNLADVHVGGFLESFAGLSEAGRAALTTHESHA